MDIIVTLPFYLDVYNFTILMNACVRNNIRFIRFNLSKIRNENDMVLLTEKIELIRSSVTGCNIIFDLPYPKKNVRIFNEIAEKKVCTNETLRYSSNCCNKGHYINVNHLNEYFKEGQKYLCQEGEGILYAEKVKDTEIVFKCCTDFIMRSGKAVIAERISNSNETDMFINYVESLYPEQIWFSFVESVDFLENYKEKLSYNPEFLMKIETQSGIDNIESIITNCSGIVFARGDLGLHSDIMRLLNNQEKMALLSKKRNVMFYIATDILSSMIYKRIPNRAEIIDIIMIKRIGCDGLMLNAESTEGARYFDDKIKLINQLNENTNS